MIRETDKKKKVIEFESDQTSLFINQDPKEVSGSRAPALKNAGLQDRKFGSSRAPVYCLLSLLCTAYCLWAMMNARANYKTRPSFSEFIALCELPGSSSLQYLIERDKGHVRFEEVKFVAHRSPEY